MLKLSDDFDITNPTARRPAPGRPAPGKEVTYNPATWELPSLTVPLKAALDVMLIPYNLTSEVVEGIKTAPQVDWMDVLKNPSQISTAALETVKPMIGPTAGTIIGSPAGIAGMALGATGGQLAQSAIEQVASGEPQTPTSTIEKGLTAGGATAVGSLTPVFTRRAPKAIVRGTASGQSRHAAAADELLGLHEKFGVSDDIVDQAYATARASMATSNVDTFLPNTAKGLKVIKDDIRLDPFATLRNKPLLKSITEMEEQTLGTKTGQPALLNAAQVNRVITDVNRQIKAAMSSGDDATAGAWKQVLGGLHEDMRNAYAVSGDQAFGDFATAIRTAHLNFLRRDLEKLVQRSGATKLRGGTEEHPRWKADPAAVENWMRRNPEWVDRVNKARPGLIPSIQADLDMLNPVTDIVTKGLPGGTYGSGRFLTGAAIAHMFSRFLGMPLGTAEVLGGAAATITRRGINYNPRRIMRAWGPKAPMASEPAAAIGAGLAGESSDVAPPPSDLPNPKDWTGNVTLDVETGKQWVSDGVRWRPYR